MKNSPVSSAARKMSPRLVERDSPLQIGLIGAGKMAAHHARAVRQLGAIARVAAVADPSTDSLNAIGSIAPEARRYPTLEALLEAEAVDAVHVCTPPDTHGPLAMVALDAGCHLYVEKPFAPTAALATEILELAGRRGLKVCAGHQLLFEAPAQAALKTLPALGELAHVESYFSFRTVRRSADGRTPLRADLQLLDILPHPVYLLLRFLEASEPDADSELSALEVGPGGTVHAFVRRGRLTGSLVVTLDGRPVESYVRLVGTNGSIHADFVRGTVQRLIGPGSSGIDKVLVPFRLARQLRLGTVRSLAARALKRQRSYPGLAETFEAFYRSIRDDLEPPISAVNIVDTVRVCEQIGAELARPDRHAAALDLSFTRARPRIAVTGGTGFLGKEIVRQLAAAGTPVLIVARREPAPWERIAGAEYTAVDLSQPLDAAVLDGVDSVIHCAAATAGGWKEHAAHSVNAAEHVVRAAHAAGVQQFVHVSSIAVLHSGGASDAVRDDSPFWADSRALGPYVWGKLESERLVRRLCAELGMELRVARPGAIIDEREFDPPGKLGRRLGNLFVAVGSPRDRIGTVDVAFAARALVWLVDHFDEAPASFNLLAPTPPTKRTLIGRLRQRNPDLRVIWLPRMVLHPLSRLAVGAQRVFRPGRPVIDVASIFATQTFDTAGLAVLAPRISGGAGESRHLRPGSRGHCAAIL